MSCSPHLTLLALASACSASSIASAPTDGADDHLADGKSDHTCSITADSDDARGILALVNDPDLALDDLDRPAPEGFGLDHRAARGILEARPFEDLDQLDAVPFVGPIACNRLRDEACLSRGLCEPPLDIMTWNIERFPLSSGAPEETAALIDELAADLVGLQEIAEPAAFDDLLELLPDMHGFTGLPGFDTSVAIAYRPERLSVVHIEDLFTTDSWRFPRPVLAVTFELKGRAAANGSPSSSSTSRRRSTRPARVAGARPSQSWIPGYGNIAAAKRRASSCSATTTTSSPTVTQTTSFSRCAAPSTGSSPRSWPIAMSTRTSRS